MEIIFLSYVDETMYLLRNLSFFKIVPPETNFFSLFSNLGLIMAQQTSIHVNCFMAGDDTLCAILSQKCVLWEKGQVNPLSLEGSLLSHQQLANRHKMPCSKLAMGNLSVLF